MEKDAALRSDGAQQEEGLQGLSVVAQQPMNLVPVVHAKNLLPLGQIGWNDGEDGDEDEEDEDIWREDERGKVVD